MIATITDLETQLPPQTFEKKTRLDTLPQEISEIQSRLDQYHQSHEEYQKQLQELQINNSHLETRIEMNSQTKTETETLLRNQDSSFYELFQEHIQLSKDLDQLNETREELKNQINTIRTQLKEQTANKAVIDEQWMNRTQQVQSIATEIENEETKLMQIESRLNLAHCNETVENATRSIPAIEQGIREIEQTLRNYCDVDDSLLSERQELESSIYRITQKRSELQEEIIAAKSAADELEKSYYNRYEAAIQQVEQTMNTMFQQIQLAAHVRLELEGSIDTLGLVIHTSFASNAEYPLHALSGGQRSMVGIGLMLALNKLNPSPFSMYDEIDMFLDPENAQHIAHLIHNLAQQGNQFVILMPDKSKTLIQLANKVVGVTRNGKTGPSTIFYGIPPATI